jgi:hypothetical protein
MTDFDAATYDWAPLVPELYVRDIERSLWFWCEILGFRALYRIAPPLGRGINLQIAASSLQTMLDRLSAAKWPLFAEPAERWYRTGNLESGQRQFLVQDPDGYLLRFAEGLGERAVVA